MYCTYNSIFYVGIGIKFFTSVVNSWFTTTGCQFIGTAIRRGEFTWSTFWRGIPQWTNGRTTTRAEFIWANRGAATRWWFQWTSQILLWKHQIWWGYLVWCIWLVDGNIWKNKKRICNSMWFKKKKITALSLSHG